MSRCRNSVLSLTDGPAHSQGVVPLGDEKNPFEGVGMAVLPDRFWEKVEKTETCWLWIASLDRKGYGQFKLGGEKRRAHRICFEALVGPVPAGLQLDHLCRVRNCVNPAHLEPVTAGENVMRGERVLRSHCSFGHERTPENSYVYGRKRQCRICNQRRCREFRDRRRA